MAPEIRFDGNTVLIIAAGNALGQAYCTFFASRRAQIVVHDATNGIAERIADQIRRDGGQAIASSEKLTATNSSNLVQEAVEQFGSLDVLIHNATGSQTVAFADMQDQDFDCVVETQLTELYHITQAVWAQFRKQKSGRIITTSSPHGLFGIPGQAHYSTANSAVIGFTTTLAKEGQKYNILANVIVPVSSRTVSEILHVASENNLNLASLNVESIVPVVAVLSHSSNTKATGLIFEAGGGHFSQYRWERSAGLAFNPSVGFIPAEVVRRWTDVFDYDHAEYPLGTKNPIDNINRWKSLPVIPTANDLDFTGKVVVVTGSGAGLGKSYALWFAKLGAKVVVNDLVNPFDTVAQIKEAGGQAVASKVSVEEGDAIVRTAVEAFGTIHVLINNAGVLRDKSIATMTRTQWDTILNVHLRGTYKTTKAAWPYFVRQKYGRVLNTCSTSGIYGNFGQSNYAAAKMGILGLTRALAREGRGSNIFVNAIAPTAGTQLTATVMPAKLVEALKPEYIAPFVVSLCSESIPFAYGSGGLYEVNCAWIGRTRLQRSEGWKAGANQTLTPETLSENWTNVQDFECGHPDSPESAEDCLRKYTSISSLESQAKSSPRNISGILSRIKTALAMKTQGTEFSYTPKDVITYNMGVGAGHSDLVWIYENFRGFEAIPTFGVIPNFGVKVPWNPSDLVSNFSRTRYLHGEQYLEVKKYPIPTSGNLVVYPRLVEVLDKINAAVLVQGAVIKDRSTGNDVFYTESSIFLSGSGGFGGQAKPSDRGAATAANKPPSRKPDAIVEEKTSLDQAALYRLSGDANPLHIDPDYAKKSGFQAPILHGLCTFGISAKHVYRTFGPFSKIKVRFSGVVLPGQTLKTEMWKERNKIIFQTKVCENGKIVLTAAGAELAEISGSPKM